MLILYLGSSVTEPESNNESVSPELQTWLDRFPEGKSFMRFFDKYSVDLNTIPLFVKAGSIIPQDHLNNMYFKNQMSRKRYAFIRAVTLNLLYMKMKGIITTMRKVNTVL